MIAKARTIKGECDFCDRRGDLVIVGEYEAEPGVFAPICSCQWCIDEGAERDDASLVELLKDIEI